MKKYRLQPTDEKDLIGQISKKATKAGKAGPGAAALSWVEKIRGEKV